MKLGLKKIWRLLMPSIMCVVFPVSIAIERGDAAYLLLYVVLAPAFMFVLFPLWLMDHDWMA